MDGAPTPDDDLAEQDRMFRAAMTGRDPFSTDGAASGPDPAATDQVERDREEFLAHLAAHPPVTAGAGRSGERQAPRRTPSLRALRRRIADPNWSPDAQLDLHGRTRDGAQAALERFIAWSSDEGLATVLVVVGQGHHSPGGEGLVADVVRQWLTERGLKFLPAPARLGGGGALLVSLSHPDRE
jgi:DNA-nicking Smr family endonuclease